MSIEKKNLFYQRKKGEPITYDGNVEPIPLPFGRQEGPDKLSLKIKATPEDWNTLLLLAEAAPEHLGKLIRSYITTPVYEKFLSKEGDHLPRGLHSAARQILMDDSRRYVAAAYAVLSCWAKRPLNSWPEDLKILIHQAEKALGEENIWPPPRGIEKTLGKEFGWSPTPITKRKPPKKLNINAVVRYLINLKYGTRHDELGLENIEDMDDKIFLKIYLDTNKLDAANDVMKKYGDSLTISLSITASIDQLYNVIASSPWEYVKR